MTNSSLHEDAQILARLTVLERVVGLMICDGMLKSGKGAPDILAFGETVKAFLANRTPVGATNVQLAEAADRFFSAIASDIGSRASQ